MQRREPELVTERWSRARGQEGIDARQMALQAGLVQGGVAVPISCLYFRALIQEQEDERKVAFRCRGDERRGASSIAGFDIGSAVEQHLGPRGSVFCQGDMNRLFRVGAGDDWLCLFFDRTSITDGPASEHQAEDGAGYAGAVVQATHGSPGKTSQDSATLTVWFSIQSGAASPAVVG